MEITHSTLEENVLQEFTKDYLEKHKELIEFVKKETIKQLTLTAVSHRRELLKGFANYLQSDVGNLNYDFTELVDDYEKTL
jgi:hypothetical protein